jgi:hypothetical protein
MGVEKDAFESFTDELHKRNEQKMAKYSEIEAHKELTDNFASKIKNYYHSFREQGFNDEQSVLFITSMLNGILKGE